MEQLDPLVERSSSLRFRTICQRNGVHLSAEQVAMLEKFVGLLLQANKQLNLISRKDEQNIWQNHILHSISPVFRCSFEKINKVLDLGTGGGMPGIPLKILFPSIELVLVDSIRKKADAVQDFVSQLGLISTTVIASRIEELAGRNEFAHSFDAVLCRAVAPLEKLVGWAFPLLKRNEDRMTEEGRQPVIQPGTLIAYKGGYMEKEMAGAKRMNNVRAVHEIPLVFHGSETLPLVDKKLVLVQFTS